MPQTSLIRIRWLVPAGGIALLFVGCNLVSVAVDVIAQAVDGIAATTVGEQSFDMGNIVVTDYDISFYSVEVGNTEADKFTLWEDAAGATQNLVATVSFTDVLPAVRGTYQFMRLTIGNEIALAGTAAGGAGTAVVTVSGQTTDAAGTPQFLFGTEAAKSSGNFLLATAITIKTATAFALTFDIAGTVSVSPIALDPSVITFVAQ